MALGISSTTSAVNEAALRRRQLRSLGIWSQGDEKAFGPELSSIGASERGDIARYGAAYANAKSEQSRIRHDSALRYKESKERGEAVRQQQAGNAAGGFMTAVPQAYKMGKELGYWGAAKSPTMGPEFASPGMEYSVAPAVTEAPTTAGALLGTEAETDLAIGALYGQGGYGPGTQAIATGTEALATGTEAALGTTALGETIGAEAALAGGEAAAAIGAEAAVTTAAATAAETTVGIAASMGAEAAATAVTAGVTDAMVAAGTAAMVPGVGWVVAAGIVVVAGIMTIMGSDGSVICTELKRQGILDEYIWHYDSMYPRQIDPEIYSGYLMLFSPVAQKMRTSKMLTDIVSFFALPATREMAHRVEPRISGSMFGKLILAIGEPMCKTYYNLRRSLSWA